MYAKNNSCFGLKYPKRDPRLNEKQYKKKASQFTLNRKLIAVTRNYAQNQSVKANANCPNQVQITNAGGPGDSTPAKNEYCCVKKGYKGRMTDVGSGIDRKHNSYNRYLARKTGWVLRQQLC